MKIVLTAILALLLSACQVSYAQISANPCDNIPQATAGKTQTQVNTILELCRGGNTPNLGTLANIEATDVSAWGAVAKDVAHAVGIAAKELGVATNDFLNSPAGLLVAFLIIFKVMGNYLAYVFISIPFSLVLIWVWVKLNKTMAIKKITYDYKPVLFGLFQRKVITSVDYGDGEITDTEAVTRIFTAIGFAVLILVSWLVW